MKAARFLGGEEVKLEDRPIPEPLDGEVLVKVLGCALCGSDLRPFRSGHAVVPGHEIVGEVCTETSSLFGTRVLVYIPLFCGECPECRAGDTHQCRQEPGLVGWQRDGGFAEYLTVPERNLLPIPDEVPTRVAPLLLDAIGTTAHGVRLAERVVRVESALILGAGPLGLGSLLVLKAMGVPRLFVSEPLQERRDRVERFGAIPAATGERYDLVIEASGNLQAREQALYEVRSGGAVLLLGENANPWTLTPSKTLRRKDLYVIRSFYFPIGDLRENVRLLLDNLAAFSQLVDRVYPLQDLQLAYQEFGRGKTLKPVVEP